MKPIATPLRQRNDSSNAWSVENPVLLQGQIGFETTSGRMKVGDGATEWNDLAYYHTLSPFPLYHADSTTPPTVSNYPGCIVWFEDLEKPGFSDGTNWFKIEGTSL